MSEDPTTLFADGTVIEPDPVTRAKRDARLVSLAERLGVESIPKGTGGYRHVVIQTLDGRSYDWIELMHAHLDMLGKDSVQKASR